MNTDERNHQIDVSINRWARGKIPRNAPKGAWQKFHNSWERETVGARDLAAELYRGFSFAPVFDGPKTKDHFLQAGHLALDFDCADSRASFDELVADDLIDFFASFLYYTPSSKPPAYKSRVVFVFDKPLCTVDLYEEVQAAFAWRFPNSDQSTTDAARFFYGSKGADFHTNWSILPLDAAAEIVKQHKAATPRKPPTVKNYQPINTEEKDVAAALRHVPKQMAYKDWLSILMAVHSVFPNQAGINLCESWSPGYDGEVEDKFKSFERTTSDGITIRTLFKLAKENGYKPNGGYKKTKQSATARMQKLMNARIAP
jgi:hypothetical protein